MKPLIYTKLIIVFAFTIFFIGCGSSDNKTNYVEIEKLERSLDVWMDEKEQNGNSYRYSVSFESWVGFGSKTTITIKNDTFVERNYTKWDEEKNETLKWDEVGLEELEQHENGSPLKLIEELYEDCRQNVLTKDKSENYIYLEFYENGILNYCTYAPNSCADDCSQGVSIEELEFLQN